MWRIRSGSLASHPQDAIALIGCRSRDREIDGKPALEPVVKRVRSEIALHDEPGIRIDVQTREPEPQHPVQFVLPDSDRWVRPDRHETQVIRNIFRGYGVDVSDANGFGITAHEVEGAGIHIDGPHRGVRRFEGEGQSDRTPAATEIQKMAAGRSRGSVCKQYLSAGVDSLGTEDAIGRGEVKKLASKRDPNPSQFQLTPGQFREIMLGGHAEKYIEI